MPQPPFVHLNVHSCFSLLEGADPVDSLVEAAVEAGQGALALTDTDGLYGAVPFLRACAEAGIRPVLGAEVTDPGAPLRRAVVLARDRAGYAELCRLITARKLDLPLEEVPRALRGRVAPGEAEEAGDRFDWRREVGAVGPGCILLASDEALLRGRVGRNDTYVEIRHLGRMETRREKYRLLRLARELELRPVATGGVRFVQPDGYRVHRALTAIRTGTTLGSLPPGAAAPREAHFGIAGRLPELFADAPEAIRSSHEIAWSCEADLGLGVLRPPPFDVPAGETPFSHLCQLAFQGLRERYRPISKKAYDTLSRELDVISRLDLAEYFLVCWDLVREARERGLPCLGRGSAANSIVSYCLWITHVDPLAHGMFFERFLNLERGSPPDFDIDFGTDDREEILDYVYQRHGPDRVAMIGTHQTMHARSAIREVAKAMGIPEAEVGPLIKLIPRRADPDEVEAAIRDVPESSDLPLDREPLRSILAIARRIARFPRHIGTHPCGIVIAPEPVCHLIPLQRGEKGLIITQWDMYPVEDAGLIKIDLLGQKGLAVIADTIRTVRERTGRAIDPARTDWFADETTRDWMRRGESQGCFYIESPIMRQILRQARCDDFETLTALSSIIRPGVSNYGGKRAYLRRHLGLEPVEHLHPALEPILADTHGCLIYQEQVIRIAAEVAGMSLAEADDLRRCMSKKRSWEHMELYRDRFVQGALARNFPEPVVLELYRQIESFAGYAFCKAHSASFAVESFESMYWKSHHPAAFMAAVLSNRGGYYEPMEYVEEARRIGLRILPPCVQEGEARCTGWDGWVRLGLGHVKGLREEAAEAVPDERRSGGPYRGPEDLCRRVGLTRTEAERLARVGAMDSFRHSRPEVLWRLAAHYGPGANGGRANGYSPLRGVGGLFAGEDVGGGEEMPRLGDYGLRERLLAELEILEVAVSAHPLALFPQEAQRARRLRPVVPAARIDEYAGRTVYLLGWIVTGKKTWTSPGKDGQPRQLMEFLTVSDESGRCELTLFPRVYARHARELRRGRGPYLIKGCVEEELGVCTVTVENLMLLRQ